MGRDAAPPSAARRQIRGLPPSQPPGKSEKVSGWAMPWPAPARGRCVQATSLEKSPATPIDQAGQNPPLWCAEATVCRNPPPRRGFLRASPSRVPFRSGRASRPCRPIVPATGASGQHRGSVCKVRPRAAGLTEEQPSGLPARLLAGCVAGSRPAAFGALECDQLAVPVALGAALAFGCSPSQPGPKP